MAEVREFETGATRDLDNGKLDYEAFLSPLVIQCYAEYMHQHRHQSDGELRPGDNWQRGIPFDAYMKSGWRHHMDWWKEHRGIATQDGLKAALCAVIFNASGYLHELLKGEVSLGSDALPASDAEQTSFRSPIGESAPSTIRPGWIGCDNPACQHACQCHDKSKLPTCCLTVETPHGMV